jgi:hypothetical protein
MKRFTVFAVAVLGLALLMMDIAYAQVDQSKLLKSAERVVSIWTSNLEGGFDVLKRVESSSLDKENYYYWTVRRLTLIGMPSYDVRRTDSLVSPYKLIINFRVKYEDNTSGPNVNGYYSKSLQKTYGYSSAKNAMKYTKPEDFIDLNPICKSRPGSNVMRLSAFYAFQGDKWVLKGGSNLFESNFFGHERTASLIRLLSDVPMK